MWPTKSKLGSLGKISMPKLSAKAPKIAKIKPLLKSPSGSRPITGLPHGNSQPGVLVRPVSVMRGMGNKPSRLMGQSRKDVLSTHLKGAARLIAPVSGVGKV